MHYPPPSTFLHSWDLLGRTLHRFGGHQREIPGDAIQT